MQLLVPVSELIDDFYQEMGERGGVFDLFDMLGIDLEDALKGIANKEEINTHYYWHIPPLEINEETKKKILKHYGGAEGLIEFMSENAQWEKYQKMWEAN